MSEVKKPTKKPTTVWLDKEQREFVAAVANGAEMTVGDVIRAGVNELMDVVPIDVLRRLNNAPPAVMKEIRGLREEVAALRLDVNRIGINVNQIARVMWMNNADLEAEYWQAVEELGKLQELLEKQVSKHELREYR